MHMDQISSTLKNSIAPVERILKLIWAGQLFPLGIYVFIATRPSETAPAEMSPIVPMLSALAVFMIVLFFAATRLLVSPHAVAAYCRKGISYRIASMMKACQRNPFGSRPEPAGLTEQEQMLNKYASGFLQRQLVIWGILHTAALYGMVLSTTTGQPIYSIAFSAIVALILLVHFPSLERLLNDGLMELQLAPATTNLKSEKS